MKTSFCTNVFDFEEMQSVIPKLAHLGYDGLEFWEQYLRKVDIGELKDKLLTNNIKVSQVCPYFNFTGTEKECKDSINIAGEYIKWAKILNCRLIRVFTGSVGSKESTKEQWQAAVKGLKEICGLGKPEGISFVLETHPNSLMDTSDSTLRLLEEAEMDNLKVNLQVPLIGEKNPLVSAERLGEYVVHLHAHNWKYLTKDYNWGELTFLDSGSYNFAEFIRILHHKGFNGYISIEHGDHLGSINPFETAEHEVKYFKRIIHEILDE